ncbi:MAG: hypothetical protein ACI9KS_002429 [Sulfitobacter sp.]|jgi:uncharacterized protein (DUF934 family)
MRTETTSNVIVRDNGFGEDDWATGFSAPEAWAANSVCGVDLPSTVDPLTLGRYLDARAIRIAFPNFADGRGFTLARRLRALGYRGRLRAHGPIISDQYAMARRAGFDEVEIPVDLAARQPEGQWMFRANWAEHDYQSRLRA